VASWQPAGEDRHVLVHQATVVPITALRVEKSASVAKSSRKYGSAPRFEQYFRVKWGCYTRLKGSESQAGDFFNRLGQYRNHPSVFSLVSVNTRYQITRLFPGYRPQCLREQTTMAEQLRPWPVAPTHNQLVTRSLKKLML
jgi:hypothetical protein